MSCETTPSFEVHYKSPFIGKMELKQIYSTFYGRSFLTLKDFSAEGKKSSLQRVYHWPKIENMLLDNANC